MIKLENVVLASPEQMEFIIQGMRNPMNSWDNSDSKVCNYISKGYCDACEKQDNCATYREETDFYLGGMDEELMLKLSNAGTEHRKYMRMMPVYVRITAPLYWWKEFDTYKVGTIANSCSTMHKIQEKEFTLDDFSCEHLFPRFRNQLHDAIDELNYLRDKYNHFEEEKEMNMRGGYIFDSKKDIWWQMIQLLPSSYNQTRNVMLNYEVLANIYKSRKNHKLDEWRDFCKWIESLPYSELIESLPYSELIVGEKFDPHNTVVGKRLDAGFTD